MPNKIQIKRGLKANLPTLSQGELGFCTDTKEVYIGDGDNNTRVNIPIGGTAGQVLQKTNSTDFNTEWADPPSGSVQSVNGVDPDANGEVTLTPANIGAASNRNLLDNWDFRNPVNQRAKTEYANPTDAYTVDRWKLFVPVPANRIALSVVDGGVTLSYTNHSNYWSALRQHIDEKTTKTLLGKQVTFSVEYTGAVGIFQLRLYGGSVLYGTSNSSGQSSGIATLTVTVPNTVTDVSFNICLMSTGDAVTLIRAKLELGSVSTLANDPPVDFAAELNKCQRYYYETGAYLPCFKHGEALPISCPQIRNMRIAPTIVSNTNQYRIYTTTTSNWMSDINSMVANYVDSTVYVGTASSHYCPAMVLSKIVLSADLEI